MSTHDDERDDPGPVPGLAQLDLRRAPQRDLWPGIEARLAPRRAARRAWLPLALAASLALAVGVRLAGPPLPAGGDSPTLAAAPAPAAAPLLVAENRALVKANLKIVSDAEHELLRALQREPESASLARLLQSTRKQRRDLKRLLASATDTA